MFLKDEQPLKKQAVVSSRSIQSKIFELYWRAVFFKICRQVFVFCHVIQRQITFHIKVPLSVFLIFSELSCFAAFVAFL